jgi:excisionase family DNA binding protein
MQIFTFYPEDFKKLIKEAMEDGLQKLLHGVAYGQNGGDDQKIYNVEEAAVYLNMAVPTLRKKYKKHIIKYIQEGRKITFRKKHLTEYLDKYTV